MQAPWKPMLETLAEPYRTSIDRKQAQTH